MGTSKTKATAPADKPEITMERHINASRKAVYDAWGDPVAFAAWMGPNGFTITMKSMDFRVGGVCRYVMHAPNGMDFDNRLLYRELKSPSRIAYTHDADVDDDPEKFQVTVDLTEQDGGTLIRITAVFPSLESREEHLKIGAIELGKQSWDKLADWVEKNAR
jgi:uncharacterized protein YndB with AHSA1/START domain